MWLIPHGQDTNDVLNIVAGSINNAAFIGVETKDIQNSNVIFFLDMVFFCRDCAAMVVVSDVKGHTANALCTWCTLKKERGSTRSDYMY